MINRLIAAVGLVTLLSCASEVIRNDDGVVDDPVDTRMPPPHLPGVGSGHHEGCGFEVFEVHHPDGHVWYMIVPLECDTRPDELRGTGPVELPEVGVEI